VIENVVPFCISEVTLVAPVLAKKFKFDCGLDGLRLASSPSTDEMCISRSERAGLWPLLAPLETDYSHGMTSAPWGVPVCRRVCIQCDAIVAP
jgi:hypothetical protein